MCFIIIDTIEICYFKYNVVVECFITIVSLALLVLIKKKKKNISIACKTYMT